jgi:DNA-binding GntR family transcriptional regulator
LVAVSGSTVSATTAYERIRQAIIEGAYGPGQRLIEVRVANELALSRTPVREALRMLQAEGLVRSEPNRGAVVRTFSNAEIRDLYDLRSRLEAYGAELAATRRTEDDLERLDAAVERFRLAVVQDGHDVEGLRHLHSANEMFHTAILAAARHQRLGVLLARAVDVPLVFQAFRQFRRAEVERSYLFHSLIRDAVAVGDPGRAGRLMAEHVLQGRDVLLAEVEAEVGDDVEPRDEVEATGIDAAQWTV